MNTDQALINTFIEFLKDHHNDLQFASDKLKDTLLSEVLVRLGTKYKAYIDPKGFIKKGEEEQLKKDIQEAILLTLMNTNSSVEGITEIQKTLEEILAGQNEPLLQAAATYQEYLNYLQSLYTSNDDFNSLPDHPVKLSQLYIEPYFDYFRVSKDNKEPNWIHTEYSLPKTILDILQDKNPLKLEGLLANPQFILLLGLPGQGKSSFCKRFLHDYISQKLPEIQKIFYLRLRDIHDIEQLHINPFDKLVPILTEEVRISTDTEYNLNTLDLEHAVLVLDGLDELEMVKERAFDAENAVRFCEALIEKLQRHNQSKRYPKIILTSRHGRINASDLYKRQVLILRLAAMNQKQQIEWLRQYKAIKHNSWLTQKLIRQYHKEEVEHILELMNQPILLNMIAKLPKEPASKLQKSQLYQQLFDTLIQRPYDQHGKLKVHELLDLNENSIRQLIRETAYAVFQSGKEYIHKEELVKTLSPKLKAFFEEAEKKPEKLNKLRLLMMSFYMQERRRATDDTYRAQEISGDFAIEFVHKSLMEYLCAEHIWITVSTQILDKGSQTGNYQIDSADKCLQLLADLFAKRRLSDEIVDNLIEIIQQQVIEVRQDVANRLGAYFDDLLAFDFSSIRYQYYLPSYPIDQCTNIFYGYWTILSYSLQNLQSFFAARSDWKNFGRFSYLLRIAYYYKLNLSGANLSGANLSRANLRGANLIEANLIEANLIEANLSEADLSEADLIEADLSEADLSEADLRGADLRGADLRGAYLREADLRWAGLSEADLRGAYLRGADLSEADLSEANLSRANLRGVDLSGAKFIDAKGLSEEQRQYIQENGGILEEKE